MDLAQTLIRSVMRAFYDTKHILVIDALIIHSALKDEDMVYLMGMQSKEIHKLCGKLREDRFLAVHTRPEPKEGQQRPINKTWYYIDYRATVDAIKWRVYCIDKDVQGSNVPLEERKDYTCPRCKSEWTQMEVLDKMDFEKGFLCHKCGSPLIRNAETDRGGHEKSTRLNAQFRFITDLLPKIDQVVVPDNTFETALASRREILRDALNPNQSSEPIDLGVSRPTAVKGINTGPTTIAVTLTASDGPTAADKAVEQARRDALKAQNQLPAHFTHSTVTGEQILPATSLSFKSSQPEDTKDKRDPTIAITSAGDSVEEESYWDSFAALLKAEREALKQQEAELESDEEYDEEVDFEDVVPVARSGTGTPASSTSVNGGENKTLLGGLTGVLKKRDPGTGSSTGGTSTGAVSPVTGPQTPESGRAAKKVRIEEPEPAARGDEESEEDDIEFEDV